jgi:hypothetical protein
VSDAPVEDSDADGESEDGEDDGPLSRPRPRTVPRQLFVSTVLWWLFLPRTTVLWWWYPGNMSVVVAMPVVEAVSCHSPNIISYYYP